MGEQFNLRLFLRSYIEGTQRLGTPLNDIRPRNMGANGVIFDPALDPVTKWLWRIGIPVGIGGGVYAGHEVDEWLQSSE